jgi:hypothetical protein
MTLMNADVPHHLVFVIRAHPRHQRFFLLLDVRPNEIE